jgi:hypothetical protein
MSCTLDVRLKGGCFLIASLQSTFRLQRFVLLVRAVSDRTADVLTNHQAYRPKVSHECFLAGSGLALHGVFVDTAWLGHTVVSCCPTIELLAVLCDGCIYAAAGASRRDCALQRSSQSPGTRLLVSQTCGYAMGLCMVFVQP